MPKLLELRIRAGSNPGEPVMIQEWRKCECQYCDIIEEQHWFDLRTMNRKAAEKIVNSHNRILGSILKNGRASRISRQENVVADESSGYRSTALEPGRTPP